MKRMLIRMMAVLIAVLLAGGAAVFVSVCVCAGKERRAEQADCIIVLGAKVRPSGVMSDSLRYRCEAALKAWQEGKAGGIIACGGQGHDEPAPEGEVMRAYFVENGVPEARVFAENFSTNTIENFRNARKIMEAQGWDSALVVTNDYHVERSLWIAKDAGIDAAGIAARSPESFWGYWLARVRESCSWVLYGIKRILRVG